MGLVTLAALLALVYPKGVAADRDTRVGKDADLTSTLKVDKKSDEWDAIVKKLTVQREKQIEQAKAEEDRKAEAARVQKAASSVVAPTPIQKAAPVVKVSGNKADWMRAAGIPEAHWPFVDSIVTRESGWNPNAVNRSSGACGLGQQLPCGKWAGAWNDPVSALKAMTIYVNARYGGWAGAVSFWNAHPWY